MRRMLPELRSEEGHFVLACIIVIYGFTLIAFKRVDSAEIMPIITWIAGHYYGKTSCKNSET